MSDEGTINVIFVGGSMHGAREVRRTFGMRPENIMVPLYGKRPDPSLKVKLGITGPPIIGREVYARDRARDVGYGERAVIAYVLESSEVSA